ncbi:hypothetical protein IMZ48_23690 [Candidatus Bathyarchaeota archaeon]|nr:hypothetical protein [Candidatus Bathyarchaeota archaeon]
MPATASPHGPSPNLSASPYDLTHTPSSEEGSWEYLDYSSSGSVSLLPSPSSGSLGGYALVGHTQVPLSPQFLDLDQQFPASGSMSGGEGGGPGGSLSGDLEEGGGFTGEDAGGMSFGTLGTTFLTPQDLLLPDGQMNTGFTDAQMNGELCRVKHTPYEY